MKEGRKEGRKGSKKNRKKESKKTGKKETKTGYEGRKEGRKERKLRKRLVLQVLTWSRLRPYSFEVRANLAAPWSLLLFTNWMTSSSKDKRREEERSEKME